MNLESKLKRCLAEQKKFIHTCDELHDAVMNELSKNTLAAISDYLKMDKSYVQQTSRRGIVSNKYPKNFIPFLKIAQAIVEIEKKKIDLEKI